MTWQPTLRSSNHKEYTVRHIILSLAALLLICGCATPPPPAPDSAASKVVPLGKLKHITVGAIRVARENGFMTVNAQLSNSSSRNRMMYYRFAWLGSDGFPVGKEEGWKTLTLYAEQTAFVPAIAPLPQARDFRLEIKTP